MARVCGLTRSVISDFIPRLDAALEGRSRIERELGQGGLATVYLADDLKHERKVALKVLKPDLAAALGAEGLEVMLDQRRQRRLGGTAPGPRASSLSSGGSRIPAAEPMIRRRSGSIRASRVRAWQQSAFPTSEWSPSFQSGTRPDWARTSTEAVHTPSPRSVFWATRGQLSRAATDAHDASLGPFGPPPASGARPASQISRVHHGAGCRSGGSSAGRSVSSFSVGPRSRNIWAGRELVNS